VKELGPRHSKHKRGFSRRSTLNILRLCDSPKPPSLAVIQALQSWVSHIPRATLQATLCSPIHPSPNPIRRNPFAPSAAQSDRKSLALGALTALVVLPLPSPEPKARPTNLMLAQSSRPSQGAAALAPMQAFPRRLAPKRPPDPVLLNPRHLLRFLPLYRKAIRM
jgi:hypothetical protein